MDWIKPSTEPAKKEKISQIRIRKGEKMEFARKPSAEPSADRLWRGNERYEKECGPLDTSRDPEVENLRGNAVENRAKQGE